MRCIKSFATMDEYGVAEFKAGVTSVSEAHPILRTHRDHFESDAMLDRRRATVMRAASNPRATERDDYGRSRPGADEGASRDPWGIDTTRAWMGDLRGRALSANEQSERMPDAAREHMARTLEGDDDPESGLARFVIELSQPDYFRAFTKWFNDPLNGHREWSDGELAAYRRVQTLSRSMTIGTTTAGGFMVPYELDPSILIASAGSVNPMRAVSRVVSTAYNEKRFVTSLGVTSSWDSEETEVSDDSPALLQPTITCRKAQTFVPVSVELFEDSDLAQQIGALFADSKEQHEALSFTITQSNGPVGLITALVAAGGSVVIATGTNVLAQGDLFANQAALPARWRPQARWMMNLSTINGYRQLPQATGLNFSIVNDDGAKPKALGWTIEENSSMDGTLTGSAADYLVLSGDFKQYAIVDRVGTSLELVPHLFGTNRRPTGQRGFYMHWRTGADVLVPDAFRLSNFST